jgi:hypothetical protein
VINISNYASKDNPPGGYGGRVAPHERGDLGGLSPRGNTARADGRSAGTRFRDGLALAAGVALDWLGYFLRRWSDRWFAMNDTEAYWRGWQITKTQGGLGRRYRDTRFDTLASCPRCAGAGVWADAPCRPCLGTGRITVGEVS